MKNENETVLLSYCDELCRVLNENGFRHKMKFHGVIEEFKYSIDEEIPSLVISEITNNKAAFEYLKQHGLIRSDICHFCGELPIDNKYTFSDPTTGIKVNICGSCHNEGIRTQETLGIKPKNSTGCLPVLFLLFLLISIGTVLI